MGRSQLKNFLLSAERPVIFNSVNELKGAVVRGVVKIRESKGYGKQNDIYLFEKNTLNASGGVEPGGGFGF